MTAVVGILCSDGIVIGTDSSATMVAGGTVRTIEHSTEKLCVLHDQIIIAGTGSVGHGQRFESIMDNAWKEKLFTGRHEPIDICTKISQATLQNFLTTHTDVNTYGALVAFANGKGKKPVLCEFEINKFQPELKTERIYWCSMGSTQGITDPFLAFISDILWSNNQPTVHQAVLAVTWTLDHAIKVNPGGVNGPARIAVLEYTGTQYKARLVTEGDLEEHRNVITGVRNSMSQQILVATTDGRDVPQLDE